MSKPGKRTCKYYANYGNKENCLRCKGYSKRKEVREL
jgi:hypothetical protein